MLYVGRNLGEDNQGGGSALRYMSLKARRHNTAHAEYCLKRSLIWKSWKRSRRSGRVRVTIYKDGEHVKAWAYASRPMPSVFCLDENPAETIAYLEGMQRTLWQEAVLRRRDSSRQRKMSPRIENYFDFKPITKISPTAALLMASIFDRKKHIQRYKPYTIDEHLWKPEVLAVLRSVGFHELLDMQPQFQAPASAQHVMVLKFISGEKAAPLELAELQSQLGMLLTTDREREAFEYAEPYGGMLEAALNSNTWAYPQDHKWDFPVLRRWWLTGAIDTLEKTVTVAVYDQGISIPASLPSWKHYSVIEKALLKMGYDQTANTDAINIRLAMRISRSKTELPQHGKGLHTMLEVAKRARVGRLRILSRRGECVWENGKRPAIRTYDNSIGGTLIEWKIQI